MFLSSDHERLVRLLIRLIYSERDPDNLRRLEAQLVCLLNLEASDPATLLTNIDGGKLHLQPTTCRTFMAMKQ